MKISSYPIVFIILSMLSSCASQQEQDIAHELEAEPSEIVSESHAEEEDVAMLTIEQIATADIRLSLLERRNMTKKINANGALRVPNRRKGTVSAVYGGIIRSLNIELGDAVKAGQIIATIADPQFLLLQEQYLSAVNQRKLAEQNLQREQTLVDGQVGAGKNLEAAIAELDLLETRLASLKEQLQLVGVDASKLSAATILSELALKSPINGTVLSIHATLGQHVEASLPIVEIVDNQSLHLDLHIFERDLPSIRSGQKIVFTPTNNPTSTYQAVVVNIGSSFQNESKTIAIHCDVVGDKKGLFDGMNVTAVVSLTNEDVLAVPDEAIVGVGEDSHIFVETSSSEANHRAFRRIQIVRGTSNSGYTTITTVEQLTDLAQVVVKGAFFVQAVMNKSEGHDH